MDYSAGSVIFNISGFLADHLITLILILAAVEVCLAVYSCIKLGPILKKARLLNKPRNLRYSRPRRAESGIVKEVQGEMPRDYHYDMDQIHIDYEKTMGWYTAFSMMISLFPLLGILGTVSGLFRAIALEHEIYVGVQFALASTIYGLCAAIVFKVIDTFIVSAMINRIEEGFDWYETTYRIDAESLAEETADGEGHYPE